MQVYTASRVPLLPTFDDAAKWRDYSTRLRQQILDEIVLRGEARRWGQVRGRVEWLDIIQGSGYRIRKLRYEAVPGIWSPALLYEPDKIAGRVPVALNVNGHEKEGVSKDYIQARCINLAKKGVPALNVEWLGRGHRRRQGGLRLGFGQMLRTRLIRCQIRPCLVRDGDPGPFPNPIRFRH